MGLVLSCKSDRNLNRCWQILGRNSPWYQGEKLWEFLNSSCHRLSPGCFHHTTWKIDQWINQFWTHAAWGHHITNGTNGKSMLRFSTSGLPVVVAHSCATVVQEMAMVSFINQPRKSRWTQQLDQFGPYPRGTAWPTINWDGNNNWLVTPSVGT